MNWNLLQQAEQLQHLIAESSERKVLIYKHSTRCNISRTTLDRLERNWNDQEVPEVKTYFLDLLSHRDISNAIAQQFQVEHQSPQVLVISNGKSIYDRSHFDIDFNQIKSILKN
jgi:bacillithiol system protein YtxJ